MNAHQRIVAGWLADLANMTAGNSPLADAKTKIAALSLGLAEDFPDARVWTKESLYAIGRQLTFFPSYGDAYKALNAWWAEHRPAVPDMLPGPDSGITGDARPILQSWLNERAINFRPRDNEPDPMPGSERMAVRLSLLRQKWPAVFDYVVRTDSEALSMARARGWRVPGDPDESWGPITEAVVRRKLADVQSIPSAPLRQAALTFLRTIVGRDAPECLVLLPERFVPERRQEERQNVPHSVEAQREAVQGAAEPVEERPGLRPLPEMTPERKRAFLAELRADPRWPNRAVRIRRLCAELGLPVLETDPPVPEVSDKKSDTPPPPPEDEQPANDRGAQRAAAAPTPKPARRWVGPWHSDPDEPAPDPA